MNNPPTTQQATVPTQNLEQQTLIMSSHVIIRDAQTKQILLNKRGS